MPNSNYPKGFADGVTIRGLPVLNTYGGKVFWVNGGTALLVGQRGGSDGNKGTFDAPFATLDFAIGQCTADRGDIIMVKDNHSETITGVGGITADVAGITIIGLGRGAQRPRFLMDGANTVTFVVSAADVTVSNCVFAAGHADIVRCFNITAAGFTPHLLEFVENVATENFLIEFDFTSTTDNNSDGFSIVGCRSLGLDASATEFIALVADTDGSVIVDNFVVKSGSTDGALLKVAAGKSVQNIDIRWNFLQHAMTTGDLLVDNDQADNTGIIAHNRCRHVDVAGAVLIDCDGVGLFDNLSASEDGLSGMVLPVIDTDT